MKLPTILQTSRCLGYFFSREYSYHVRSHFYQKFSTRPVEAGISRLKSRIWRCSENSQTNILWNFSAFTSTWWAHRRFELRQISLIRDFRVPQWSIDIDARYHDDWETGLKVKYTHATEETTAPFLAKILGEWRGTENVSKRRRIWDALLASKLPVLPKSLACFGIGGGRFLF